jgi:riboflavin kinase / FMN adenylyltransferase
VRVVRGFEGWPAGPLHLAIGVFDGVHRGHQELTRQLSAGARAANATAVVATFDPIPISVLAPGAPPSTLSDAEERAELLEAAGADAVVIFRFDPAFAEMPATGFFEAMLRAGEVRRIVVGSDFHFGRDREGNVSTLTALGRARGVAVEVVSPVARGGAVISSTRIRNLLVSGDVKGAADLLGRFYLVRGEVVGGDRRGRALGYPTINVTTPPERLLPRDGIYATFVTIEGTRRPAATSLGVRPTFGHGERLLESYILDFSGDLYGRDARIEFVERIRDELRFETADELVAQIAEDVRAIRRVLSATT